MSMSQDSTASSASRSPHGERGLKYADLAGHRRTERSLSSRRAWIEIVRRYSACRPRRSLSSRRAWIEIQAASAQVTAVAGRSPHGERGLKYWTKASSPKSLGRSPHGERGLKWLRMRQAKSMILSLSSRRAWIEMRRMAPSAPRPASLSSRRAWIEI